jgi:DNA (cytosine-5)-methyltransferase 1
VLTIGSLFSGIGGLEMGLERAGLGPTRWQCEKDPDALAVLSWHWPHARRFRDVELLSRSHGESCDGGWDCSCEDPIEPVDIMCGGFPCQDLSAANVVSRPGLKGDRSGLWRSFFGAVDYMRPSWVVVENVGSHWREWVPVVRRDLQRSGYASVPLALSPAELGYPHHRDRVFVVAYAHGHGEPLRAVHATMASVRENGGRAGAGARRQSAEVVSRADGFPAGLARLPGNAVVVDVAEHIGRGIAAVHRSNT